ncbi:alpha/beta hydrolase [Micromonospora lupini]|uniref:alpha/beta hydrolase n=1 Tax=Micromonospora lupini TaxID=285679 RepID=UPI0031DD972A
MRRRQLTSALVAILLAGVAMVVLPRHGNTDGWQDTFSPALPPPSGSHDVGVRRIRLVDHDRRDPWRPDSDRTLMVDVHYPADAGPRSLAHYAVAPATTEFGSLARAPGEEQRLGLVADDVNWMFRTHSHEWAPPASGSFPVLVGSPPPGVMRTAYTGVAEELASHGYVVISIDHPFDAPVVDLYPTRRVIEPTDAVATVMRLEADATRVADIAYVTKELSGLDPQLSGVLDLRRLGLFGWTGSDVSQRARLARLPGVSGIADTTGTVGATDIGAVPLLIVGGSPVDDHAGLHRRGWRATVTIPGAFPRSLTDDGVVLAQIAQRYPRTQPVVRQDIGTVQPLAYRTVRHALVRFFDHHLSGVPAGTFAAEPGVTVDVVSP